MPVYKLHYFNLRARGELIRLIFAVAGVEYEDYRISFSDWPSVKANYPFEQVPVLEVDGKFIPQTHAIQNFLAEEFDLFGKGSLEKAQCFVIDETLRDVLGDIYKIGIMRVPGIGPQVNPDPNPELIKTYKEATAKQLILLEKYIHDNFSKSNFAVGNQLTLADLALVVMWDVIEVYKAAGINELLAANGPTLVAHRERILALPRVKAYYASRPTAIF